ncbi:hypothetical protein [Nostoc sp. WHI]|uniref:hypothetical protein n=1 Tax=Nostoc sp. WHI TaxID=2650611 RepID=UPI0018C69B3C|nr:hypothetical protein [Nostoc sp. WHI]
MFSPIFSCALVQSVVAMSTTGYAYAVATAVSVTVSINSLQTYSSFHLIEPHRKPVVIKEFKLVLLEFT